MLTPKCPARDFRDRVRENATKMVSTAANGICGAKRGGNSRRIRPVRHRNKIVLYQLLRLAGALGFEPRITRPKPVALPLGHAPIYLGITPIAHLRAYPPGLSLYGGRTTSYQHRASGATERICCGAWPGRLYSSLFRASRSVAQPGSAPRSGRGGRRFKSCHSDQLSLFGRSRRKGAMGHIFPAKAWES
jgi:hypothetical protein